MLFLEAFFRSAGAMTAVLWAVLLIRDARDVLASRLMAAFALASASALIIHTAEGLAPPAGVRAFLLPLSTSWIVLLWLAARSLFDDEFRLTLLDGAVVAVWLSLSAFNYPELAGMRALPDDWLNAAREIFSYALVAHIVYIVVRGKESDLVDARRRYRIGFALSLLSIYLLNKTGEAVFGYSALPLWFTTVQYGLVAGLFAAGGLAVLRLDRSALGLRDRALAAAPARRDVSDDDRGLIDRLDRLMEEERAYLDPDLAIRGLATQMQISEHRLRALINQAMGYRNFRAFLNGYRIKCAAAALADPARRNVSILQIAMDSGFGSLASFNRTFKQETGMAPSDLRRGAGAQDPPVST